MDVTADCSSNRKPECWYPLSPVTALIRQRRCIEAHDTDNQACGQRPYSRQALGHKSLDSTLAYVNPSDADASAALAKAFNAAL